MSTSSPKIGRYGPQLSPAQPGWSTPLQRYSLPNLGLSRVHWSWEYWCSVVLAAAALIVCGYLVVLSVGLAEAVGCSGNVFDCDSVLRSGWSKWLGLPVALPAAGLYALLLAVFTSLPWVQPGAWRNMLFKVWAGLALLAGLAALWFLPIQLFSLGKLCPWCLGAHVCGLTLGLLAATRLPLRAGLLVQLSAWVAAGLAILIGGQFLSPSAPTYRIEEVPGNRAPAAEPEEFEAPESDASNPEAEPASEPPLAPDPRRTHHAIAAAGAFLHAPPIGSIQTLRPRGSAFKSVAFLTWRQQEQQTQPAGTETSAKRKVVFTSPQTGNRTSLTVGDWPHLGSLESPHQLIEMVDYTCSHCRTMHRTLKQIESGENGKLGITVLVVPIHSSCNPHVQQDAPEHQNACFLGTLSIAVWRADREKFEAFHHWLMEGQHPPSNESAMAEATRLVGAESLETQLDSKVVRAFIEKNAQLYGLAGAGPVPKVLFEQRALVGELRSAEELRQILRNEFPEWLR